MPESSGKSSMRLPSNLKWRRLSRQERRNLLIGLVFTGPWLLRLALFIVYPIVASFVYSFTRYDVIRSPKFIGFENYREILFNDEVFRIVMGNTLYFVVIGVPVSVVVAFLLASLLNTNIRFRPLFRTIFFIPSIVPLVAIAMVWIWIYNPNMDLSTLS